ncbi:hypothetical protein HXX76_006532 [Chlamydomonas incerta]|uniref:Protein kinase domain-containing protein n=1 Tax=Chlamydomonas incerta TaxID=51695 RepID=A0A835TDH4_CHLIN|nr:hypothetical protein HXX76_006532 [Chlamydomonas incerta]|eukprot:KAG2436221.1 hypothetical protein HXX76_006532 [Chlamydomonas incerta]
MFRRLSARPGSPELAEPGARASADGGNYSAIGSPSPRKREPSNGIGAKIKQVIFRSPSAAGQPDNSGFDRPSAASTSTAASVSSNLSERGPVSSDRSPRRSHDYAAHYLTPPQSSSGSGGVVTGGAAPPSSPPPTTTLAAAAPQQQPTAAAPSKPSRGLLSLLLRRSSSRRRDAFGGGSGAGPAPAPAGAGGGGSGNGRSGNVPAPPPPAGLLSGAGGDTARHIFDRHSVELPASPSPVLVRPIPSAIRSPFSTSVASAAAAAAAATAAPSPQAAAAVATQYQRQSCNWPASEGHGGAMTPRGSLSPVVAAGDGCGGASAISAIEPLLPQCTWEPSVCCSEGDDGGSGSARHDGFSTASTMTTIPSVQTPVTPPTGGSAYTAAAAGGSDGSGSGAAAYGRQQQPAAAAMQMLVQARTLAVAAAAAADAIAATAPCSPSVRVAATSPSFPSAMMAAAAAAAAQAEAEQAYAAASGDQKRAALAALSRSMGPAATLHHHLHQNQQHKHLARPPAQHLHYSPQLAAHSHQPPPHRHQHFFAASDTDCARSAEELQQQGLEAMTLGPLSPPVFDTPSALQPPPLPVHQQQVPPLPHARSPAMALPARCAAHPQDAAGARADSSFWSGVSAPTASSCHHLLAAPRLLPHAAAFSACEDSAFERPSADASAYASSPPLATAPVEATAHHHHPHSAGGAAPRSAAAPTDAAPVDAALPPPVTVAPAAAAATAMDEVAAGSSQLLATSLCTPPAMQRPVWRMEDYALTRRLYRGQMASVYKGRCLRSGLPVALKVYFKARVAPNVAHMVMREAALQLRASAHRFVLKLYGVFQTEELVVFVCELASRGSLAQLVGAGAAGGRCTRLSETQLRQAVLEPLLDALGYLHSKGVCHRDIKPENILFTANWDFRLADFGVSIDLLKERAVTRAGTADYMAPEVERCPLKRNPDDNKHDASLAYSTAADVWSIGILAYELMVGFPPAINLDAPVKHPHTGTSTSSQATISFPASVSAGARDFITQALALRPEDRPTAQQLRAHAWLRAGARSAAAAPAASSSGAAGAPGGISAA